MPHDYNTRTKNQEEANNISVAIANLETNLLDGFSSLKDKVIKLKDVIIRDLQEENTKLRSRVKVLENKFDHLEQHGRRNNNKVSGIPDSIGDDELECLFIKIMKAIDIEVDQYNIEACSRIDNEKGTQRKQLSVFGTIILLKEPFITRRN